jgi:hypothetical protein
MGKPGDIGPMEIIEEHGPREKKPKKYCCTYHKDETKHLRKHRQTLCPWKAGGSETCGFATKEPQGDEISRGCLISIKTLRKHIHLLEEVKT